MSNDRLIDEAMKRLDARIAARDPEAYAEQVTQEMRFHYQQAAEMTTRTPNHDYMDQNPGCRVYWGSHGCDKMPGHKGGHECACCECDDHCRDHEENGCVARPPYYGPDTRFYGEDVEALGLPTYEDNEVKNP